MKEEEMTRDKTIDILRSIGLTDDEILVALKEIKTYSIEEINDYVTNLEEKNAKILEENKKKQIEKQKNYQKNIVDLATQKESQIQKIKDKIEAAQRELRANERLDEKSINIDEEVYKKHYCMRVVYNGKSYLVGLDDNATVNDFFKKVENSIGKAGITISYFSTKRKLARTDNLLEKECKYRRIMFKAEDV